MPYLLRRQYSMLKMHLPYEPISKVQQKILFQLIMHSSRYNFVAIICRDTNHVQTERERDRDVQILPYGRVYLVYLRSFFCGQSEIKCKGIHKTAKLIMAASLFLSLFSSCCNFSFQHFQFRKLQLIKQQQQQQRPQGSPEQEGSAGDCMSCHIIQLRKLL